MTYRCAYCGRWGVSPPYVDSSGIGWMPNCNNSDCEDLAVADAYRQREAMKAHDRKD